MSPGGYRYLIGESLLPSASLGTDRGNKGHLKYTLP
jgi:hypothetical protein